MAVVQFKCDTCKRIIELPRDPQGLEIIQRCIITEGCRGKLLQQQIFENFIRGTPTPPAQGLEDWEPRKALFNYTQTISRSEWVIEHNMGIFPSVQVFADAPTINDPNNRVEVTPQDIITIDENNIKLIFDTNTSGVAQLIARETDPTVFNKKEIIEVQSLEPLQITANAYLSLATLSSIDSPNPTPTNIDFEIVYFPAEGASITKTYSTDLIPSIESPWSSQTTILIKGKVFNVRSFSILVPEMSTGEISNGSTFQITRIDLNPTSNFQDINPGEIFILLAREPYTNFDTITNKIIDVTDVSPTQNTFSFIFSQGEMYSDISIIQNIYPLIRSTN